RGARIIPLSPKEIPMRRSVTATFAVLMLCSITLFGQAPSKNFFAGTWKLNPAKSTYSPGPAPKSQVAKIEAVDGGMKVVSDRVESDGKTTHFEWTAKFDGKDYPVKGDPGRDAVSVKRMGDDTLEITNKKEGKVTGTIRAVYAHDGKSRVETASGT